MLDDLMLRVFNNNELAPIVHEYHELLLLVFLVRWPTDLRCLAQSLYLLLLHCCPVVVAQFSCPPTIVPTCIHTYPVYNIDINKDCFQC